MYMFTLSDLRGINNDGNIAEEQLPSRTQGTQKEVRKLFTTDELSQQLVLRWFFQSRKVKSLYLGTGTRRDTAWHLY